MSYRVAGNFIPCRSCRCVTGHRRIRMSIPVPLIVHLLRGPTVWMHTDELPVISLSATSVLRGMKLNQWKFCSLETERLVTVSRLPEDRMLTTPNSSSQLSDKKPVSRPSKKRHARAIKRVLDGKSREIVGWLYEWNTGQIAVMWKDQPCEDVIYV